MTTVLWQRPLLEKSAAKTPLICAGHTQTLVLLAFLVDEAHPGLGQRVGAGRRLHAGLLLDVVVLVAVPVVVGRHIIHAFKQRELQCNTLDCVL